MITYEEFLKRNNIADLRTLFFGQEQGVYEEAKIEDDPKEYFDIAKKAKNLRYVRVGENQSSEFYESLIEFVKLCNEEIEIANGIVGKASKSEFLRGEEKIKK